MIRQLHLAPGFALAGLISLAACGGGGGSTPSGGNTPTPPPATPTPTSQQVIRMALPSTAIGVKNDATYGTVAGFTQTIYSQVLGFAPGQQVMIMNAQASGTTPHTLGDTGGTSSFPASAPLLSTTASGGSTLSHGFQSGTLTPGQSVGPITLTAGTYYIGCAFHYSNATSMRDVLVVAAGATPGPAATPQPGATDPPMGGGGGY